MNLNSIAKYLGDALVRLAKEVLHLVMNAAAQWLYGKLEQVTARVSGRVRGYSEQQRSAGVPEEALSRRVTDAMVDALDALRSDLLRRRETLSAEQALAMFEEGLALPQLA